MNNVPQIKLDNKKTPEGVFLLYGEQALLVNKVGPELCE